MTLSKECFFSEKGPLSGLTTVAKGCQKSFFWRKITLFLHHHLLGFKGRGSEEEEIYSQVKYGRTSDQCKTGKKSWMTIDTLYHCPSQNLITKSMITW